MKFIKDSGWLYVGQLASFVYLCQLFSFSSQWIIVIGSRVFFVVFECSVPIGLFPGCNPWYA